MKSLTDSKTLLCIVVASLSAMTGSASGTESDSLASYELAPISVTAPRVVTPLLNVPAAISVVGRDDIRAGRPEVAFDEALGRVTPQSAGPMASSTGKP